SLVLACSSQPRLLRAGEDFRVEDARYTVAPARGGDLMPAGWTLLNYTAAGGTLRQREGPTREYFGPLGSHREEPRGTLALPIRLPKNRLDFIFGHANPEGVMVVLRPPEGEQRVDLSSYIDGERLRLGNVVLQMRGSAHRGPIFRAVSFPEPIEV